MRRWLIGLLLAFGLAPWVVVPAIARALPGGSVAFSSDRCSDAADHDARRTYLPLADPTLCRNAVWLVDDDGTGLRRVTDGGSERMDGGDVGPSFSPEGLRLAFARSAIAAGGFTRIWVRDVDGREHAVSPPGPANRSFNDSAPRWLSNGRLVFLSNRNAAAIAQQHVYSMNADGSDLRQLTFGNRVDLDPVPTRDGRRIAFYSYPVGPGFPPNPVGPGVEYSMNLDGTDIEPLSLGNLPPPRSDIAFSPDGRYVAVQIAGDLYTMAIDGSDLRKRTGQAFSPAWSASGPSLIYSAYTPAPSSVLPGASSPRFNIFKVDVSRDGAAPVQLTDLVGSDVVGDWHPLGLASRPLPLKPDVTPPGVILIGKLIRAAATPRPAGSAAAATAPGDQLAFLAVDRTGVRRLDAAIARRSGRACRFFDGRSFRPPRSCTRPLYHRVRSVSAWRAYTRRLGHGFYELRFRAADLRGNVTRRPRTFHVSVR